MFNEVVHSSVPNLPIRIGYSCSPIVRKIINIHFHDEIEMIRVVQGCMSCIINDKTHIISDGDIIFINSRVAHETYNLKENTVSYLIQVNADEFTNNNTSKYLSRFLLSSENQFILFKSNDNNTSELSDYIDNIMREYSIKNYAYETYIKANIYNIFAFLYRQRILIDTESLFNTNRIISILPALNYIEQHYQDSISLETISAVLNLNPFYFCRIFKKATNSTFTEYLNFVRVCNAEKLLTSTNKNIMEVSLETGFSSVSYFNRTFKRYKNCTPSKYRKIKYSLK